MKITVAQARKAAVAVVAFIGQLIALNALPERLIPYAVAIIAALTALGVYVAPNAPSESPSGFIGRGR